MGPKSYWSTAHLTFGQPQMSLLLHTAGMRLGLSCFVVWSGDVSAVFPIFRIGNTKKTPGSCTWKQNLPWVTERERVERERSTEAHARTKGKKESIKSKKERDRERRVDVSGGLLFQGFSLSCAQAFFCGSFLTSLNWSSVCLICSFLVYLQGQRHWFRV